MSANVTVTSPSFPESIPKNTLVATTAVEGRGVTYALQNDFGLFKVNKRGKIKTKGFLDFETAEEYNLVLVVTNKRGGVKEVPFTINITDIDDVTDLSATITYRAAAFHEGTTKVNNIVADIFPVSNDTPSYAISGVGSEYFRINNNGKIKVNQALDYSTQSRFDLVVTVSSGGASIDVPVGIDILENLAPDFTTACQSSCSLAESAATGTVVINASRTDTDIDDLTYSLENNFGNKFAINQDTGQVTLNSALDYETTNSYTLNVIATDSKGVTKNRSSTFNVTDIGVGYSGTLVSATKAESIATGTVILNSSLSGSFSNPTYSISGGDSKFAINSSTGQVTLANPLDYETESSHVFSVTAEAGGESETRYFTLNVSDVGVGYSGTLVSSNQSEIIPTGTVILNSALSGSFGNPTYSISGGNSKFAINSSTGQVTLANSLDYETKTFHQFTVTAQAGGETEQQTFTLNVGNYTVPLNVIAENGQTVTGGGSGSQFSLGEFSPVGTVVSTANSGGTPGVTYSLLKHSSNNPLQIDTNTGTVSLGGALDYETASNFIYQVLAHKGNETRYSGRITYLVENESYTVSAPASSTSTFVKKGEFYRSNSSNFTYLVDEDITSKGASDRVIGNFSTGVAGTTYSLGGTHQGYFSIDSSGILTIDDCMMCEVTTRVQEEAIGSNPTVPVENFALELEVIASIPGEGNVSSGTFSLKGKNVEANENLVMKFASGYSSKTHNFQGANPFTAIATRNSSGTGGLNNAVVTESVLTVADRVSSPHINSANDQFYTRYGQGGGKSYYRTSTRSNGDNEHGTEILDFEYWFPIDSNAHPNNVTARQYAPMSDLAAAWDDRRPNREEAKYRCLDSGQGCGGGTTEVDINGNWTSTTEGSDFSGYLVTQRNFNRSVDNLLNANANGSSAGNGSGTNTLLGEYNQGFGGTNNNYVSEFEIVALPETFEYFGQSFSHIYVNENGFLSFGNGGANSNKPWHQVNLSQAPAAHSGGGRPLMYLHESDAYNSSGNNGSYPDDYRIPDAYGKPVTHHANNLDNTIFALWNDYYTDGSNNNWSIRQLWNSTTKILTIGWYNIRSYSSANNNAEANFEVQLDFNDDSFRIVHGDFGAFFPDQSSNNAFVGISKDVSCASSGEDISMCEGKDYIQLYFHDNDFGRYESPQSQFSTFQNPDGNDQPSAIDHMWNSYFTNSQTVNGTKYCYSTDLNLSSTSCALAYDENQAKAGTHFTFAPQGTGGVKNVLLPSDIKQSYRSGLTAQFMWMHLDKDPTTLVYTPPANNATGFDAPGPNSRTGVTGGSLSAGSAITHTTALDEIVIAGEVYANRKLESFLGNAKKVVAYAPIPLLHTNKYELPQLTTNHSFGAYYDDRYKRVHTIMPPFISTDYMESKDNGTDANFDFHQLNDNSYFKGNIMGVVYNSRGTTFNSQLVGSNWLNETRLDGMYGYAAKVLDHNTHVASERFGDLANNADFVPTGQSLWYQVFNPTGRGVGLFAQLSWSCGLATSNINYACHNGQHDTNPSVAPHHSQQSLFSVLIVDSGDKSNFAKTNNPAGYSAASTGTVVDGSHYWSYKRRDGRTATTDGEYAGVEKAPQIAFGINPIACVSGPDNGCFFGDNQGANSSTIGAPSTAIITTSDPCSSTSAHNHTRCYQPNSSNMELGVMYSMEANSSATLADQKYKTETFYQGIAQQKQYDGSNYVDAINLNGSNSWRTGNNSTANTWTGRFSGHWLTDVASNQKSMPQYFRSGLTASFDETNDRVKVTATNIYIHADPDWNENTNVGENTWYHSGPGCSFGAVSWSASSCVAVLPTNNGANGTSGYTLQFGDDDNQKDTTNFANSAYINKKVFGAMLKNESKNLNCGSLCTVNILRTSDVDNAGALVTWDTIDEKDKDWMSPCTSNFTNAFNCTDPEPSLEYMTWGVWAFATNDGLEYMAGEQPSAVHMGTWYAGDLLDASDWPVSRTATLAGMAMFNMWKSQTVSGVTTNYAWTEGSRADGSVVFDGSGNYGVTINVHDLGQTTCSGAASGYPCSSGAGSSASSFDNGQRMGTITWTATNTSGNPNFSGGDNAASVNNGVSTWKYMQGSLYGTASHVEAGAELIYSKQDANNYIQAIGTVILSE